MANANRDENRVTTLLGVSSLDLTTPTKIAVDPATNEVLVQAHLTPGGTQDVNITQVNGVTANLAKETGGNLATVKTNTDNLDVALSTRLKPADTLTKVATVDTITNDVTVKQGTATNLKTQAEAYQGGTAVGTGNPLQVSLANTGANATALKVDGTGGAFPVSGSVTASQGTASNLKTEAHLYDSSTNGISSTGNALDINIKSGSIANTSFASTIADGADVTLGAKADARSTATDTTAVTLMQVLKEISYMEQNPASRAVTNAGTFAVQATTKTALTASAVATYTVTTSSAQAVAANANRKGLILVNLSDNIVFLGFGQTAVLNSGIALNKYGSFTMDEYSFSTALVNAITTTGGATLSIQEYT